MAYQLGASMGGMANGFIQGIMQGIDRQQTQRDVGMALDAYRQAHHIYRALPEEQWQSLRSSMANAAAGPMFGSGNGQGRQMVTGLFNQLGSLPDQQAEQQAREQQTQLMGLRMQEMQQNMARQQEQDQARQDAVPVVADQIERDYNASLPLMERGLQAIGVQKKPDFGQLAKAYTAGIDPFRASSSMALSRKRANEADGSGTVDPVEQQKLELRKKEIALREQGMSQDQEHRDRVLKMQQDRFNAKGPAERAEASRRLASELRRAVAGLRPTSEEGLGIDPAGFSTRVANVLRVYGVPIESGQDPIQAASAHVARLEQEASAMTSSSNAAKTASPQPQQQAPASKRFIFDERTGAFIDPTTNEQR